MNEILVTWFPLATIGCFIAAGISFVLYFNAAHKLQVYLRSEYPGIWERMGRPDVFSKNTPDQSFEFHLFLRSDKSDFDGDAMLLELVTKTRKLLRVAVLVTGCSFALFCATIFVMNVAA